MSNTVYNRKPGDGGAYKKGNALSIRGILTAIADNLASRDQWADHKNYDNAAEYQFKAEALIELLEVDLCGSTGGFAPGQPPCHGVDQRFVWLRDYYAAIAKAAKVIAKSGKAKAKK